jgi:hypothetical protein
MTSRKSRAGSTGPTLLVVVCAWLGALVACLWGVDWRLLWTAVATGLAVILIAAYRDGRRDTEGELDPVDAWDLVPGLAADPGPAPRTAAELGRQLTDADIQDAFQRLADDPRWDEGTR